MRLPSVHLATAFISSKKSAIVPQRPTTFMPQHSAALFATTITDESVNMKSNAATQAEGTVIVGGGIAGLAVAAALRNVAGGKSNANDMLLYFKLLRLLQILISKLSLSIYFDDCS